MHLHQLQFEETGLFSSLFLSLFVEIKGDVANNNQQNDERLSIET